MANINSAKGSFFDGFATELEGKFQRIASLTPHGGTSGSYHEEILRSVLRNFLTKRFSVKTGFIYLDEKSVSKQIDILIIDENEPAAYVFQEGDVAIVMPEAVVAVIEVKTTLDQDDFTGALDNIAIAKGMVDYPARLCGIVFGYQGREQKAPSKTQLGNWFRDPRVPALEGNKKLGPNSIMWFTNNLSLFRFNPETIRIDDGEYYHIWQDPHDNKGWQLSMLLAQVISACESKHFRDTRMLGQGQAGRLLKIGGVGGTVEISVERYNFLEGSSITPRTDKTDELFKGQSSHKK